MAYDRDMKWIHRVLWLLLAVNGGLGIERALRHDWATMIAYLIWFANLCYWRQLMKVQQRTRDLMRLHEAALMKVLDTVAGERDEA